MGEPRKRLRFSLATLIWVCSLTGMGLLLTLAVCDNVRLRQRNAELEALNQMSRWVVETRLGPPLGTVLTLAGTRASKGKLGTNTLWVDRIDGQRLPSPVQIEVRMSGSLPPEDVRCEIVGYESGEWIGTPQEVCDMLGHAPQAGFQYQPYFVPVKVKLPADMPVAGYVKH